MGPRSFAGAFEGCGDGSHSSVGDSADLDGGTQPSRTEERCRGFVEPLRREGRAALHEGMHDLLSERRETGSDVDGISLVLRMKTRGSSPHAEPTRVLH
jgi:hypothetical protein